MGPLEPKEGDLFWGGLTIAIEHGLGTSFTSELIG